KDLTCTSYVVGPLAASDHFPIEASINSILHNTVQPILRRPLKNVDLDLMGSLVGNIQLDATSGVDAMLDTWQAKMTEVIDTLAPLKLYPWCKNKPGIINSDIRLLISQRNLLARRVLSAPSNPDLQIELGLLKRRVKSNIRRAFKCHGSKLLAENDTKSAWKFIREVTFSTNSAPKAN